jgi:hypothetical protein
MREQRLCNIIMFVPGLVDEEFEVSFVVAKLIVDLSSVVKVL